MAEQLTREWVKQLVIGEGLCPFAHPVFDRMPIHVSAENDLERVTQALMDLLQQMAEADPNELPTALFVSTHCLHDFHEYWHWVEICERLLQQMGYEGVLQLATFHPNYVFAGEDEDDMSHYTNRSPFPMLHIIREADIEQALATIEYPERIPERNQRHLRRLGREGLLKVMPSLAKSRVFHAQE